jgi:hypothetical protein
VFLPCLRHIHHLVDDGSITLGGSYLVHRRRNQIIEGLHSMPGMIKKMLEQDKPLQQLAMTVSENKSLLLVGRGYQCVDYLLACLMRAYNADDLGLMLGMPYAWRAHSRLRKSATCTLKVFLYTTYLSFLIIYQPVSGILAGEPKHGPLTLINENIPVIIIMTRDSLSTPRCNPRFHRSPCTRPTHPCIVWWDVQPHDIIEE